eukprot:NODE_1557_length_1686_cov_36.751759_g1479_i0.p1 GENE.NODE_1557_length_1686_cov_36.751759_g1479_i0~~NODE_1557_length_1686_cov_36.751759_g1479_i0.p1  ORF type:complete len:470 (+),score=90.00 NODE_1557_length_1686_cov_36.751759_g1479_i0:159-1568(+)
MEAEVEEAGLTRLTMDQVLPKLENRLGVKLDGERDSIERQLHSLQSDEAVGKRLQKPIRELVRQSKFKKLSRKECLRNLECVLGPEVHSYKEEVTHILAEEQNAYLLAEGQPAFPGCKYILGETLGKGHYGLVRKAMIPETKEIFACKLIETTKMESDSIRTQLKREIDIMKTLVHENVLHLIEVMETPQHVHLVLELVDGGELFEFAAPPNKIFPQAEARCYFQQLILGISYCHKRGVAHRDLKPANLLVNRRGVLKVSDFGLSAFQTTSDSGNVHKSMELQTCCGSPKYIAPEIISGGGYNGFLADVWSCGVILYLMLAGHAPFEHKQVSGLLKKVMTGQYEMPSDFSPTAKDLISKMLVLAPEKRLLVKEIVQHPWFQVDFDNSKVAAIESLPSVSTPHASNHVAPSTFIPSSPIGSQASPERRAPPQKSLAAGGIMRARTPPSSPPAGPLDPNRFGLSSPACRPV